MVRDRAASDAEDVSTALLRRAVVPVDRPSGVRLRDDVDVTCELACEDSAAILSLADGLGRLFADLWFAGKLDHLSLGEEPPDADDED
jgi:hypothetical protein